VRRSLGKEVTEAQRLDFTNCLARALREALPREQYAALIRKAAEDSGQSPPAAAEGDAA
jgi:hypothetical protein